MFDKIYPQMWMELPHDIRVQLAKDFALVKSKGAEVIDQKVVSDGHSLQDLAAITTEKMAAYVGSEADFVRLWELTVAKAKSIVNPPIDLGGANVVIGEVVSKAEDVAKEVVNEVKKVVKPKKNAKTSK